MQIPAAEGARGRAVDPPEFGRKIKRVPVSAAPGDLLDRQAVLLQQRAGVLHPQANDVFERGLSDVAAEQPEERRLADPAPGGQLLRRYRARVIPVEPAEQPGQLRRNFTAGPVGDKLLSGSWSSHHGDDEYAE